MSKRPNPTSDSTVALGYACEDSIYFIYCILTSISRVLVCIVAIEILYEHEFQSTQLILVSYVHTCTLCEIITVHRL